MGKERSLGNRYDDSYDSREGTGGGKSFLVFPKGTKFYKAEENGKNKVNVIPYEIKSKNHPLVKAGKAKVGELAYNLDVWVHKNIGPSKKSVICPKRTFNSGICPICDQAQVYYEQEQKKEYDNIKAKRRVLYNVQNVNAPEDGLMVFDTAHGYFEKKVIEVAKEESDGGPIVPFADISDGKVIKFRGCTPEMGKSVYEFESITFLDREEELKDAMIDDAISFDEFITIYTADELTKILFGADDEDEDDDVPPSKPREKAAKPKDDAEDLMDDEDEKPKKSKAKQEDAPAKSKCPHGHKWHTDTDEFPECDKCEPATWKACSKGL